MTSRLRIAAPTLIGLALVCGAQDNDPNDPLCRAAQNGDLSQVRALLAGGGNPNVRDDHGQTPLMAVAAAHHRPLSNENKQLVRDYEGVANALLDKGADVNARDDAERTALLLAMEGSASEYRVIGADDRIVRLLIARGADINAHDKEGWTPLLKALNLLADQPALIDFLVTKGADVNAKLNDGRSGMMVAARVGKDERIKFLIGKGADVNARDNTGATALMIAATIQWDDSASSILKLLSSNRADVNARDSSGKKAADRAADAGYLERAMFLISAGTKIADIPTFLKSARNEALLRAIEHGEASAAAALLKDGADANFRAGDGRTLLMIASNEEYSAEKAILLLDHGANPNLAGANGDTPLMVAVDRYQPEIVKALLDHGANPNALDRDGNSVLMRAAASKYSWQEERKPLIHFLIDKGADAGVKNLHSITALMLMAREGNPGLRLLLEKGVAVDARDDEGNTALLHAANFFARGWPRRNGWALLEKGADVNAANQRGETALILASTQFESDAAQLLLQKGANVNAKTKSGRTALMQAIDQPKEFDNEQHVVYSPAIAALLIEAHADVNAADAGGNTALSIAKARGYLAMAALLEKAGARQ